MTDPLDFTRLFFEELRRTEHTMRQIDPGELTEKDIKRVMPVLDELRAMLYQVKKRKDRQKQELKSTEFSPPTTLDDPKSSVFYRDI